MDDTPGREPADHEETAAGQVGDTAAVPVDPASDALDDPADPDGDTGLEPDGGRDPRRFNDWRKRSATGAVMTGIALGLREALELPRERPALVIEAPGEPDDPDHPIDLRFDPDSPEGTVAIVRQPDEGGTTARPAAP